MINRNPNNTELHYNESERNQKLEEMRSNVMRYHIQQNHDGCFSSSGYKRKDHMPQVQDSVYVIHAAPNYSI